MILDHQPAVTAVRGPLEIYTETPSGVALAAGCRVTARQRFTSV